MFFLASFFLKKLETFKWLTYVETFVNKFGEYSKKKKKEKRKKEKIMVFEWWIICINTKSLIHLDINSYNKTFLV